MAPSVLLGNRSYLTHRFCYRAQIISPTWLKTERYDITAKTAVPATENQMRLMLQALLTERFRLVFHRETKTLSVYDLVVAKSGSKLVAAKGDDAAPPKADRASYTLPNVSMKELATILQSLGAVSLPVVDRTALEGKFDIALKFPDGVRPSDRPGPDMSEASIFPIIGAAARPETGLAQGTR